MSIKNGMRPVHPGEKLREDIALRLARYFGAYDLRVAEIANARKIARSTAGCSPRSSAWGRTAIGGRSPALRPAAGRRRGGGAPAGVHEPAGTELHAKVCWMHPRALQRGKKYFLKHTTQTVQAAVTDLASRINIQTFDPEPAPPELAMNDIGEIKLRTSKPLIYDGYVANRLTGSFILIELGTNATAAAGMLQPPTELVKPEYDDFAI